MVCEVLVTVTQQSDEAYPLTSCALHASEAKIQKESEYQFSGVRPRGRHRDRHRRDREKQGPLGL